MLNAHLLALKIFETLCCAFAIPLEWRSNQLFGNIVLLCARLPASSLSQVPQPVLTSHHFGTQRHRLVFNSALATYSLLHQPRKAHQEWVEGSPAPGLPHIPLSLQDWLPPPWRPPTARIVFTHCTIHCHLRRLDWAIWINTFDKCSYTASLTAYKTHGAQGSSLLFESNPHH